MKRIDIEEKKNRKKRCKEKSRKNTADQYNRDNTKRKDHNKEEAVKNTNS